ncbi:MAG: hypothetical protein AAB649_05185 [Patescibacteria group bacterium]
MKDWAEYLYKSPRYGVQDHKENARIHEEIEHRERYGGKYPYYGICYEVHILCAWLRKNGAPELKGHKEYDEARDKQPLVI